MILINLTNHPADTWPQEQRDACNLPIVDLEFPFVDPTWDTEKIRRLAVECVNKCDMLVIEHTGSPPTFFASIPVHVMGEQTLTYALVLELKSRGYLPMASTTTRETETVNGKPVRVFKFIRFRLY